MRAFEVELNGKKLCLAGVGGDGAFAAVISHVVGRNTDQMHIRVGGTRSVADGPDENVEWASRNLKAGDEIRLRVVEKDSVDRPKTRKPVDGRETRRSAESLCRTLAKKLGWKVITSTKI